MLPRIQLSPGQAYACKMIQQIGETKQEHFAIYYQVNQQLQLLSASTHMWTKQCRIYFR